MELWQSLIQGLIVVLPKKTTHNGDTIVEVMFATAIAGLIIVMAMAIMNRGVATAQMAVEYTLVRQGVDSQTEALRYLRDNKSSGGLTSTAAAWNEVTKSSRLKTTASIFGQTSCQVARNTPTAMNAFYIDTSTTGSGMIKNYANNAPSSEMFATPGKGIWIEATSPSGASYVDFHVRACWQPPFSGPDATVGTIVRLSK